MSQHVLDPQPELLDDILRKHEHHRPGVDDALHASATNTGFVVEPPLEDPAIDRVLQLEVD